MWQTDDKQSDPYCKHGYFRWGKISRKCWQDISRGVNFHDTTPIPFIKTYGFYFRVGVIFMKKTKARKTWKLPPCENFHVYSMWCFSFLALQAPPYQTGQFTATLPLSCSKVAANNLVHQKREMQFAAIRHYWLTCGELIAKGSPQYYWFAKSSPECNYSPKVHHKSDCSPKVHHK